MFFIFVFKKASGLISLLNVLPERKVIRSITCVDSFLSVLRMTVFFGEVDQVIETLLCPASKSNFFTSQLLKMFFNEILFAEDSIDNGIFVSSYLKFLKFLTFILL